MLVLAALPASAAGTASSEGQCIFNSFKGIKLVWACLLTVFPLPLISEPLAWFSQGLAGGLAAQSCPISCKGNKRRWLKSGRTPY